MRWEESLQLREAAIQRHVSGSVAAQADVVGKLLGCVRLIATGPYHEASSIAARTLRAVAGDA